MFKKLFILLSLFIFSACQVLNDSAPIKDFHGTTELYPIPKEISIQESLFQVSQRPIILIGQNADATEQFAAERLQTLIKRKSNITLSIFKEGEDYPKNQAICLLGKRSNNKLLDELCRKKNIKLTNTMPNGFGSEMSDGFIIQTVKDKGQNIVVVGGSNSRGVLYGQESLSELLSFYNDNFVIPELYVKDWPSVKWRKDGGWIKNSRKFYLEETGLEALIRSRSNLLMFKLEDDDDVNRDTIQQLQTRGFMIDAGVHGAIDIPEHDKQLKYLKRFLDLGANRVYVSFDDQGMGEDPVGLIKKVVKLSHKYGIKDDYFSVTTLPYAELPNDNPKIAKVLSIEGFEKAHIIITRPPEKELHRQATERHMNYQFWHNWPMNFDHLPVLKKDEGYLKVYHMPMPFKTGWWEPTDDTMRLGSIYTANSMFSLAGTRTTAETHGYAWNPGALDWQKTEEAIYTYLFGKSSISAVKELHQIIRELSPLYNNEQGHGGHRKIIYRSPLGLKDLSQRPSVLKQIARAQELFEIIKDSASNESLVEKERLQEYFLEPLENMIDVYRKAAQFTWPEELFSDKTVSLQISKLIEKQKMAEAEKYLESEYSKIEELLERIEDELADYYHIDIYLKAWQDKEKLSYWIEKINNEKAGNAVLYIKRDKEGMVSIEPPVDKSRYLVFYSIDGKKPSAGKEGYAYHNKPFEFKKEGLIRAVIFDYKLGIHGHIFERQFGHPKGEWKITVEDNQKQSDIIIDDDLYSHWVNNGHFDIWNVEKTENKTSSPHPHEFIIDLGTEQTIGGFGYMPGLRTFRKGNTKGDLLNKKEPDLFTFLWGAVADYKVYLSQDGETWTKAINTGHFSYPKLGVGTRRYKPYHIFVEKMYKRVHFDKPYQARYFKFVVESIYDKQIPVTSMNELDIFSD